MNLLLLVNNSTTHNLSAPHQWEFLKLKENHSYLILDPT
jgi:hypothetical protein